MNNCLYSVNLNIWVFIYMWDRYMEVKGKDWFKIIIIVKFGGENCVILIWFLYCFIFNFINKCILYNDK